MSDLAVADADGTITVTYQERPVLRYRAITAASKPHVDHLAPPADAAVAGGRNLVLARPHDHPWHLGLFFVQKLVDGINCWEAEPNAAAGRTHGWAHHERYDVDADDAVILRHDCEWRADDGEPLLADTRTITIEPPADGGVLVRWDQQLTAVESRRRLGSETLHGHYSGLAVRFRRSMRNGRVLLPDAENPDEGRTPRSATGPEGTWCDYTGRLDGSALVDDPLTAGITLMAAPPADVRWFTMQEPYGFLAANPTWEQVRRLDQGASVTWQFGSWVHGGTPDREQIAAQYERFRRQD